jgi:opacity protein-like surface antigen
MKTKTLLLTAMATFGMTVATMAQNVPNYVPTNGLVGWWPFNGNATDESGSGNNGTVNGATLQADRMKFQIRQFANLQNFVGKAIRHQTIKR